ncbi:MAG: hypothetical protein COU27_00400 [Candidatus Levybacteria bacterium CG10_big_fil_rev_8_21_14_0_10_36_7]|nr:MAG: hypothetical protein COU27_00400 [Candidatus Levybacteria bacterium CG10_big_fil_rev_8_21_14_0_10_36_7]
MGYTKDAVRGLSWLGGYRVIYRGISFGRTAITARLLTPSQFGLFGIVALVFALLETITETSINIFLIQEKDGVDKFINTAWVVSIIRGIIIAVFIVLLASPVSAFFNSPEVYSLMLLMAIAPLIRGFINPSVAKFIKELKYNREFYYRSSIFLVESAATIIFASYYQSATGLVLGLILGATFEVAISFLFVRPTPIFSFELDLFKNVFQRGKWLTATGIFNYLYHNLDNIVIGKFLGSSPLGLYQMAYKISYLPISEISDVFGQVTFPVFVKMSEDVERLRKAYFKSILLISALTIPVGVIFFLFPQLLIRIVLGDQWIAAAPALQVLAAFGVIRAISISAVAPFYAVKRQEVITLVTLVSVIVLAITIIPLVSILGIVGAAYSALLGAIVPIPIIIFYFIKIFSTKPKIQ